MNIAICSEDRDELTVAENMIAKIEEKQGLKVNIIFAGYWKDLLLRDDLWTLSAVFISGNDWEEALPKIQMALLESDRDHPTEKDSKVVLSYLHHPLQEKYFTKILKMASGREAVSIPTKDGARSIPVRSLIYFENVGRKIVARTIREDIITKLTMTQAKRLLHQYDFFVCPYVSFLINLNYIKEICSREILMKNNRRIPLSEKRAANFKRLYRRFLENRNL